MTHALRARHRHAVTALAVLLPAGVAIALAARPAPLPAAALGVTALDATPPPLAIQLWEGRAGDPSLRIDARLGRSDADAAAVVLDLDVRGELGQPETLAYWTRTTGVAGRLPDDAILLGPVGFQTTHRFALPAAARGSAGSLILYRIAPGSVAATLPLPAASAPGADGARS